MEQFTIYTAGMAKANPGPALIGVCVVDKSGQTVLELSESIGNASNEYAQYFAVVKALQALVDHFGAQTRELDFVLEVDNQMVYQHLCAEAQITDVSLIGYFIEIYNLRVASFPNLTLTPVEPGKITKAHTLVKAALDGK